MMFDCPRLSGAASSASITGWFRHDRQEEHISSFKSDRCYEVRGVGVVEVHLLSLCMIESSLIHKFCWLWCFSSVLSPKRGGLVRFGKSLSLPFPWKWIFCDVGGVIHRFLRPGSSWGRKLSGADPLSFTLTYEDHGSNVLGTKTPARPLGWQFVGTQHLFVTTNTDNTWTKTSSISKNLGFSWIYSTVQYSLLSWCEERRLLAGCKLLHEMAGRFSWGLREGAIARSCGMKATAQTTSHKSFLLITLIMSLFSNFLMLFFEHIPWFPCKALFWRRLSLIHIDSVRLVGDLQGCGSLQSGSLLCQGPCQSGSNEQRNPVICGF